MGSDVVGKSVVLDGDGVTKVTGVTKMTQFRGFVVQ